MQPVSILKKSRTRLVSERHVHVRDFTVHADHSTVECCAVERGVFGIYQRRDVWRIILIVQNSPQKDVMSGYDSIADSEIPTLRRVQSVLLFEGACYNTYEHVRDQKSTPFEAQEATGLLVSAPNVA